MRKPVNKLHPDESRAAVWTAIRAMKNGDGEPIPFTVRDMREKTQLETDTIRDYLTGLTNAGYLSRTAPGGGKSQPVLFKLLQDCGIEAPRVRKDGTEVTQGKGREQMWRALGILGQKGIRFTFRDLCLYASTADCPVAEEDVKHYIRYLAEAGYLLVAEKGGPRVAAKYRMPQSKWTGPKPPMIQRVRQLYDPNLKKVVWSETGGAE